MVARLVESVGDVKSHWDTWNLFVCTCSFPKQNKKLLCNPKQFDVLLGITNEIILHVIKQYNSTHSHTRHTHTQACSVHVTPPPFLCSFSVVVHYFKLKHMVQPTFSCPPLFSVSFFPCCHTCQPSCLSVGLCTPSVSDCPFQFKLKKTFLYKMET